MKHWPLLAGVTLLALGAWLSFAPPSLPRERELLRVGEWRATVSDPQRLPAWMGPFVLGVGSGFALLGLVRRR
jgi:hypothetical protein